MSHGVKGLQLPIEEAFKASTNVDSEETPSETAVEPQSKSESVPSPGNVCEEYTELPLHTLAQESVLTAINTGMHYGHLGSLSMSDNTA